MVKKFVENCKLKKSIRQRRSQRDFHVCWFVHLEALKQKTGGTLVYYTETVLIDFFGANDLTGDDLLKKDNDSTNSYYNRNIIKLKTVFIFSNI